VASPSRAARALACFATLALCAAAQPVRDPTTFLETTATATVAFPPDRLFVAVDVESEAGVQTPIGNADLDAAVKRLRDAGIPASAVAKRFIATADPRWKRVEADLDPRPYGIILLVFPKPSPAAPATLTGVTLPAAFGEPLGTNTFAEVGGAWYGIDDCKRLRVAARKGALALARARGATLAAAAGFVLDISGGLRSETAATDAGTDEGAQSYVCGRDAQPDLPPPQIHLAGADASRGGLAEEESTITVGWPTLALARPRPLPLPSRVTSLGTVDDAPSASPEPLSPGTVRASVALSSGDVEPGAGCSYDRALRGALALALARAAFAGRAVGLVPDRPLRIVDATDYRALCPARGPAAPAPAARIDETFSAAGFPSGSASAHLEARGTMELRVPADRGRFVAQVTTGVPWPEAARRLAAAGAESSSLRAISGGSPIVEGFVAHPTPAVMRALDAALTDLAEPSTSPSRTFLYALDECSAIDQRIVRGAVDAARAAARADASRRGARLRAVVAIDAGLVRVRHCGPHVLDRIDIPQAAATAPPSTDASVTADGAVTLQYSI
jgi:uncharacterized protein YggE